MSLLTLPPDVSSLLARWQAAHDMTNITNQLVDETRALLTALTTLRDQRTQLTNLTKQVRQLIEEQTLCPEQCRNSRNYYPHTPGSYYAKFQTSEVTWNEPSKLAALK